LPLAKRIKKFGNYGVKRGVIPDRLLGDAKKMTEEIVKALAH